MNRWHLERRDEQDTWLRDRNRKRRARYALVHGHGPPPAAAAPRPPTLRPPRHYTPGVIALAVYGYVVRGGP